MRKLQSEDSVKFTAIVLAGGMSRRLGRDKAQEVIAYWPALIDKTKIQTKVDVF